MGKDKGQLTAKQQAKKNQLDQLDNLGKDVNEFIFDNNLSAIENAMGDFILRVKNNIEKEKLSVSSKISDLELKTEGNEVQVLAYPWIIYQDRGVNGTEKKHGSVHSYTDKMPPVGVFVDWIKTKNIQLRNNEDYREEGSPFKSLDDDQKITSAAWGMAKNVYKNGIKPKNIITKEYDQLLTDLQKEIADFTSQSIIQLIDVKPTAKRKTN